MKKCFLYALLLLLPISSTAQISFKLSTERLSDYKLSIICDGELKWLRNEIFARHGYVFSNKEYQEYFERFDWYKAASDNSSVKLSDTETANVNILRDEENRRHTRVKAIKTFFKELRTNYKSVPGLMEWISHEDYFKEILQKINVDEMSFCGSRGKYSVTIDNGSEINSCFLDVDGNTIRLGHNTQGISDCLEPVVSAREAIGEDMHWGEGLTFWQFIIDEDNSIRFEKLDGAG